MNVSSTVSLPTFRYHPDPLRSGSVIKSDTKCRCCKKPRGYIYTGPVYSEEELDDALCPWCIADGSAHNKFDATFVDSEAFEETTSEVFVKCQLVEISRRILFQS